ncbi:hypothetical protein C8T65DRAFT_615307 [Cerioporus squamosus]|nr:hypothetical protein C8T65DRAFT_615307 [Cerioporus squamosus]
MGHHLPYNHFTPTFFPDANTAGKRPPLMPKRIINLIEKASSERQIADAWAKWLNPSKGSVTVPCPGYRIGLSQDKSALKDKEKLKIDAALYKEEELPTDGRPHWESSHLLIEFKRGGGKNDPFDDEDGDGASDTRTDVRGQITTYVANAFSQQHRIAMFFLLINGNQLRVTRWDRSGTVFTEAFKYTEERARLRNVLWGFSRLDDEKQGFDTTATLLKPGDPEYALMDKLKIDEKGTDISEVEGTVVKEKQDRYTFHFVRQAFVDSLKDDAPRYRLIVPTKKGERRFLVGKATFVAPGMTGRGTRGFVAWDVTGKRFTFLKDAWRPHYQDVSTEGKVLQDLRSAGVENTPTYVCDAELGDVTKTPLFAGLRYDESGSESGKSRASGSRVGSKRKKTEPARSKASTSGGSGSTSQAQKTPDVDAPIPPGRPAPGDFKQGKNTLRHFHHYRVVVEEVCLPLDSFKTGEQLVCIIRDCVKAHEGAATKAKLLHRDISAGNILICPRVEEDEHGVLRVKWRGMLADWEMSKPIVENEMQTARQVVRTGTWQFASVYILDNPEKPVRIADEIESFFHVTLYNALRYLRHNCDNVQITMFDYFDWYSYNKGQYRCGGDKRTTIRSGKLEKSGSGLYDFLGDDDLSDSQPLNFLFGAMLEWFEARYKTLNYVDEKNTGILNWRLALARRRAGQVPGGSGKEGQSQKRAAENQLPIDSHAALLELLDMVLEMDWPKNDRVDDQLKKASDSDPRIPPPNFHPDPQPDDSDDDGAHRNAAGSLGAHTDDNNVDSDQDDNDNADKPDPDEPAAKRRRSRPNLKVKERMEEESREAEADQSQPPRPLPVRTRGSRTTRGSGSRTASMYNLRSGRR